MRIFVAGLAVLLLACNGGNLSNGDTFGLDFEVDPDEVAPGDSIRLELENESDAPVRYNLCTSELELRASGQWERIPAMRPCTRELRVLGPGEVDHFRLQLPADLAEGTYRFTTAVHLRDAEQSTHILGETFRVRP